MLQFSKLETTIIVLLTASVIAAALFEGFQREVVVKGNSGQWFTEVDSDWDRGGKSIAIDRSNSSQLRFEYKMDQNIDFPQTMLILSPDRDLKISQVGESSRKTPGEYPAWQNVVFDENELLNLDWMENIHVVARIEGKKKETFRFVFRNRIDHLWDDDELISRGFNQGLFSVTDTSREIVLRREQFQIPTWWLEKTSVDLDQHNVPVFKPLDWIELSPGSMASGETATLIIDSIKFSGHYFPSIVFYSSVLGIWMLAAVGVLVQRSYKYALELQMLESQVQKANIDFLTGLLNRNSVSEDMDGFANYAANSDAKLSLVMFDIDNFKTLNDTYGHNHGDVILSNVGRIVSQHTQSSKLVAVRWGGEEFLVFAEEHGVDQAAEIAELLRQAIEDNTEITCSFGVYELCGEDTLVEAIGKADKALYASKWQGRNRTSVYGDEQSKRLNQIIAADSQDEKILVVHDGVDSSKFNVDVFVAAADGLGDQFGNLASNHSK